MNMTGEGLIGQDEGGLDWTGRWGDSSVPWPHDSMEALEPMSSELNPAPRQGGVHHSTLASGSLVTCTSPSLWAQILFTCTLTSFTSGVLLASRSFTPPP